MKFEYQSAVLRLAGNGDVESKLSVLKEELNLQERIEFEGTVPRDRILSLLRQATIGITPIEGTEKLAYAIRTKVCQYMTGGPLALITGRGETKRFVNESGDGVHVANELREIAERLDEVLADGDFRDQLDRKGSQYGKQYDRQETTYRLAEKLTESFENGGGGLTLERQGSLDFT
ncbi:glycosyltransferase [Halovenus sp. HT40]|uniref:glycosyltransferase n=1 Tax=Halovenus sp. HT40 TaxID=3126691 RepID=UPI00300E850D